MEEEPTISERLAVARDHARARYEWKLTGGERKSRLSLERGELTIQQFIYQQLMEAINRD